MAANTFGHHFTITTFGESHGPALGVVVDGCPSGIPFDMDLLTRELDRRRPGSSDIVSQRQEPDQPEVLSGVYQDRTLGTPVAIMVRSTDARPQEYEDIARAPRPGHADDVWKVKFGHVDPRGGGRASGRETVARVMGGAVAHMAVSHIQPQVQVSGFARSIGPHTIADQDMATVSAGLGKDVEDLLRSARKEGRSYGGIAEIRVDGAPAGLGQPVFHKLKSDLAAAYMSVGATIGVEFGAGFSAAKSEGTVFHRQPADRQPYGGIRGGISTGEPMVARVAFKPTATVLDAAKKGRHDPCIVPRAIPVLEAMTWVVLADHLLRMRCDRG